MTFFINKSAFFTGPSLNGIANSFPFRYDFFMRVLLVEPLYRKWPSSAPSPDFDADAKSYIKEKAKVKLNDESLWYPPLALMKLSRFHKERGHEVKFVIGCDESVFSHQEDTFNPTIHWDRVYISTLFTFHFDKIVETINFYKDAVGGSTTKIFVGGIAASLMEKDFFEETGIYPETGIINSPKQIGLDGDENIDMLPPDYDILDNRIYAINDTYYGYASRGCVLKCPWCGVPKIEPSYQRFLDFKSSILEERKQYGDKPKLKLMDNNVLASPKLEKIVEDLLELGYERGQKTDSNQERVIDFNQGLDATYFTEEKIKLISQLNIKPMRVAFDRAKMREEYIHALELAKSYGFKIFSNYMLYNWKDTPKDLYQRLEVNIELNKKWRRDSTLGKFSPKIYSYPMRYAPITQREGKYANRKRDWERPLPIFEKGHLLLDEAIWNKKFIRSIQIMRGAANGSIPPAPDYAKRIIGHSYEEFIENLYMPEILLRNRNKFERRIYKFEPKRKPGDGKIEEFRKFIRKHIGSPNSEFLEFQNIIFKNSKPITREFATNCKNREIKKWAKMYHIH